MRGSLGAHLGGDLLVLLPGRALGDDLLHQDEGDGAAQAAHRREDDLRAAHRCARRARPSGVSIGQASHVRPRHFLAAHLEHGLRAAHCCACRPCASGVHAHHTTSKGRAFEMRPVEMHICFEQRIFKMTYLSSSVSRMHAGHVLRTQPMCSNTCACPPVCAMAGFAHAARCTAWEHVFTCSSVRRAPVPTSLKSGLSRRMHSPRTPSTARYSSGRRHSVASACSVPSST